MLFYEPVDSVIQVVNGLLIAILYSLNNTLADMIFQHKVAGVIDRCPDCGKLDQDLAATRIVFYHSFDGFDVTDGF